MKLLQQAKFHIGQVIRHRLFNYRGVMVDVVDPIFLGSEAWYDQVARSHPPRDKPWYRALVHEAEHETYVAERNLELDPSGNPIRHPLLDVFFTDLDDAGYRLRFRHN